MAKTLTALAIGAATRGAKKNGKTVWLSDGSMPRGHGGLQLRVTPDGNARWYWRYSVGTEKVRISLGVFSTEKTPACLTLPEARQAALDKASLYQHEESRDVRQHLKRMSAERDAIKASEARAAQQAAEESALAGTRTLLVLMQTYQQILADAGKQSARDVKNLIKLHIELAHPALSVKPACEITPDDVNCILRPLVSAGKGRTAGKLRSYMMAAYGKAAGSRLNSNAPQALLDLGIAFNPVTPTGNLSEYNNALDRTLNLTELHHYWGLLGGLPDGAMRDALMLALLLGGQRPAQLVRITTSDIDLTSGTITLKDPKGKRKQPRVHKLPICDEAREVINNCFARAKVQESKLLLSSHGDVPIRPEQLSKIVKKLSDKALQDQVTKSGFQLRDIRRTAETLLAGQGIAQEVLARLLSHGLGGVQNKHYNFYAYSLELKLVLIRWEKLLMTVNEKSNIVELRAEVA